MLAALLLEAFLLFVLIVIPKEIAELRPYAPPKVQPYEVIYYSGDELPRTEDLGGAQSGATGRAGGHEAHHRTQTIHVARGGSLAPRVVDAPDLKLPSTAGAVANLLAFKANPAPPNPGPPPSEGLHSSLVAPSLPANVIAPAPGNVARDQSRSAPTLGAVIPPAPNTPSDRSRTAPVLNAAVVPPAPSVRSEHTLIAPALDPSIIAPAPTVNGSRERTKAAPSLDSNVVGPASTRISRDQSRSAPELSASVVAPAPTAVNHEVSPTRVQMNNVAVVPPPVSAPERETARNSKLNLPPPSVVAPPPSADSTHDLRRLESGGTDASRAVVPPPPTPASNGSFVSSVIGKLFGTQDVVPPPPAVSSGSALGTMRNAGGGSAGSGSSLANNVVPPPPSVGSGTTRGAAGAQGGGALSNNVVPPPPSIGGSGSSTPGRVQGSTLGASNVIPPPPSVAASTGGSGTSSGRGSGNSGAPGNGTQLASNVVPPPPSIGSGPGLSGSGSGRKGVGLGGPGDSGSVLAPPKSEGGSNSGSGIVISSQPGSKVGMPGSGGKGSIAMSPSGGDKPGLGGSAGGASIGHGDGPGSGLTGPGSGAGKTGTGVGSDPAAHNGISPTPGPGGAGNAPTGSPAVPGVDVRGGSTNVVNLPSFGSDGGSAPTPAAHSPEMPKGGPAIQIVATSRSGGVFDFYGRLPGDNYSVFVDSAPIPVAMQFAEVNPAAHAQAGALVGPVGYVTDLPDGLPHARVVIKCRLDTSGKLKNLQVLVPGPAEMTAKIMASLPNWKFRPAMRGAQPVEVDAILGFNVDTNDHN